MDQGIIMFKRGDEIPMKLDGSISMKKLGSCITHCDPLVSAMLLLVGSVLSQKGDWLLLGNDFEIPFLQREIPIFLQVLNKVQNKINIDNVCLQTGNAFPIFFKMKTQPLKLCKK